MVISPVAGCYHSRLGRHWCGGGGVVPCGVVLWVVGVVWCGGGGIWCSLRGWRFSFGVAHCVRGLFAIFLGFYATIDKIFILAGGLGTRVSFYEI